MFGEDGSKVCVRVALVQKDRFTHFDREAQLCFESAPLRIAGRVVPKIVQAALADGDDLVLGCKLGETGHHGIGQIARMVRVQTCCRPEQAFMALSERYGSSRRVEIGSGDDHASDPGLDRAFDDMVEVVLETVVRQIRANVDQVH